MGGWVVPTAYLMGAGWYFAICVISGIVFGSWLDGQTGLKPMFTIIGVILGLVLSILGGYRLLKPFWLRLNNDSLGKGK
tara:strand:- start:122 stop:358 length:237 start_codon:yes stop_codon:yes gene_type:complete